MGAIATAFYTALDEFNAGNYNGLTSLMHTEVILNEVDYPYTPHQGNTVVATYLNNNQAARRPQLMIDNLTETVLNTNPSHGQVTGAGHYQDNSIAYTDADGIRHAVSAPLPVRFVFNLRSDASGNWLIINGTATLV